MMRVGGLQMTPAAAETGYELVYDVRSSSALGISRSRGRFAAVVTCDVVNIAVVKVINIADLSDSTNCHI